MIKLPNNRENWNWHQWLTFRCNFSCEYCIMEASSHSIHQKRIMGKDIFIGILLNLLTVYLAMFSFSIENL